ncbi:MAG: ribonuclease E/G [Clostridia bacterium]|nr:ribonuclease E/G [Clostridia bacterium]
MSKQILMEVRNGQREIALLDGKRLLAFFQDTGGGVEAEQIYFGVVDRIVKGMEACFVRLGKEQVGFLPFAECMEKPRSGNKLLVQVKKPPIGEKAPYLTADIALAGRYVILTPCSTRFAVSQKITAEGERARLKSIAARLAPAGCGLVMRTESADAGEEDMAADTASLLQGWNEIREKQKTAQAPCMLKGREDALSRLLRDEHGEISEILTNAPEVLPSLPLPVRPCENPFDLYGVRTKLEKSMQRKVWLDCGGYLVIDKTEALTVIDVNSGKFTGGKTGTENTFVKLNVEAAQETARILRLRSIGGIVIIDFVDMQAEESRAAVQKALEDALRDDPVKAVVHGFTTLGLMEMTRKKN